MRAIRDMSLLEIDITNACMNSCSNCTRFCGHHEKPYFMEYNTFKQAIDSLEGFGGLISIIGGEPLLHPEFPRFVQYLKKVQKTKILKDDHSSIIAKDYLGYAQALRWIENSYNKGAGYNLFTSIPPAYYKNYELIHDTFTHLFLNDHSHPSYHQPILISRKDLGIDDETFAKLRENCWLQNFWSASITPKGAFFCEVAGTLDMLFNGPGGWPVEPGWWKRDIKDYADQFHYCEMCGMALQTFSRNANDEIDDVSPRLYKKLQEIHSPGLNRKKIHVYDPNSHVKKEGGEIIESLHANYEPDYAKRLGTAAQNLRPKNVFGVFFIQSSQNINELKNIVPEVGKSLNKLFIIVDAEYIREIDRLVQDETFYTVLVNEHSYGIMLNKIMSRITDFDWLIVLREGISLPNNFAELICSRYLNPGYLFVSHIGKFSAYLFNKVALAIQQPKFQSIDEIEDLTSFINLWEQKKRYELQENFADQPDMDIEFFRDTINEEYHKDQDFIQKLKEVLSSANLSGNNLLVTHSAFIYHTTSIIRLIKEMNYQVYVISSKKFAPYFENWVPKDHVYYFENDLFDFDNMLPLLESIRKNIKLSGAIVPFFPGASTVKPADNYDDVLKAADYVTEKIVGIINVRREFVTVDYDWK